MALGCASSGSTTSECPDAIEVDGGGPKNPFLADSIYAIPHGDSAQQDSTSVAGPEGPTKMLDSLDCSEGVDSADCVELQQHALQLATRYLQGLDGVYAMLDSDN